MPLRQMLNPQHILCVDDDLDTCEILQVSHPEIRFTFAHTFVSGLELIRHDIFDLYLLDNRLPDGSGLDLCREIRKTDTNTPVVFLSAAAYAQDHQQAMEEGASAYLDKPADWFRLETVMIGLIWETESRSLSAKAAVISAIRETIDEWCQELDERKSANRERVIRENEYLSMAQAYSAFIESGGVKAHFERLWTDVLNEILANKPATED
jgi:DNA-binding response OmpR family regulator